MNSGSLVMLVFHAKINTKMSRLLDTEAKPVPVSCLCCNRRPILLYAAKDNLIVANVVLA